MDAELREFLENFARSFDRRMDELALEQRGVRKELHDVREEMRDLREEMRSMRTELRGMSQRISEVGLDYREARQVRDVRAIALEARVNELERRMSELEGGRQ